MFCKLMKKTEIMTNITGELNKFNKKKRKKEKKRNKKKEIMTFKVCFV